MDTKLIEYMTAIEREQSISRAAEALFITQSALNQQLLKLEDELGTRLFERRRSGMVPTYAGRVYLDAAHRVMAIKNEAYRMIHDINDEVAGELSVAYTPELGARAFTMIYPQFHKEFPEITVRPHEARVKRIDQLLLQREVTIACTSYYEESRLSDIEYHDIRSEFLVLGLPRSHPLSYMAGEDSHIKLPLIDLNLLRKDKFIMETKEIRIRDMADIAFAHAGYTPGILFETESTHTVISMITQQIGPGFFQQSYVDPTLPMVYFTVEPRQRWTLGTAHLKGAYVSRPEQYLMDLFAENMGHMKATRTAAEDGVLWYTG